MCLTHVLCIALIYYFFLNFHQRDWGVQKEGLQVLSTPSEKHKKLVASDKSGRIGDALEWSTPVADVL